MALPKLISRLECFLNLFYQNNFGVVAGVEEEKKETFEIFITKNILFLLKEWQLKQNTNVSKLLT